MNYSLLALARDELEEAISFYNQRTAELGDEFTIRFCLTGIASAGSSNPDRKQARSRRAITGEADAISDPLPDAREIR